MKDINTTLKQHTEDIAELQRCVLHIFKELRIQGACIKSTVAKDKTGWRIAIKKKNGELKLGKFHPD